jgi:hypothetical protein
MADEELHTKFAQGVPVARGPAEGGPTPDLRVENGGGRRGQSPDDATRDRVESGVGPMADPGGADSLARLQMRFAKLHGVGR